MRDRDQLLVRQRRRSSSAPLDTSDRCDASLAEHRALVEHPLHRAAGQADERLVDHRPIEPQIDGDDRRRRHPAARDRACRASARRSPSNSSASANHGTARRSRAAGQSIVAGASTAATPPSRQRDLSRRAGAHRAAVRLDERRAPARRTSGAAAWSAARSPPRADRRRTSRPARARTAAPPPARAADSAPPAPAAPTASRAAARLAVANQPVLDRLAGRRRHSPSHAGAARARACCSGAAIRSTDSRSRHVERVPVEHAGEQMQRRRQRRAREPRPPPVAIDHRHRELRLRAGRCPARRSSRRNANVSV